MSNGTKDNRCAAIFGLVLLFGGCGILIWWAFDTGVTYRQKEATIEQRLKFLEAQTAKEKK